MSATSWWLLAIILIFAYWVIDRITKTFIACSYLKMIGKISERVDDNTAGNTFLKLLKKSDDF